MPTPTTEKKRTRNVNSPLAAGQALDRIVQVRDSREERKRRVLAMFEDDERETELAIIARVQSDQRARFDRMLAAYESSVETDAPPDPHPRASATTTEEHEPTPNASLMADAPRVEAIAIEGGKAQRVKL